MQCSVVIPCHNGVALTKACIESLLQQTHCRPCEILLVDNASQDATENLAAMDPCVRVLRQSRNLGFAGGVNVGIRAAREPFVLVLNNDTQAAPNLLVELHAALAADPRIGAVAPVSNHVKGPALLAIGNRGRDGSERAAIATELASSPVRSQDVDTLAGLCLLVRRATFAEVGLFDERFGHGNFEDDDFCLRLRLAGCRLVIARRAFLHHEGHATFRALGLDLRDEIGQRRVQFIAKWQNDPAGRATIAAMHGDLVGAAAAAEEALRIWPRWPDAEWHLGRWRAARGEHDRAAVHFRALLRLCPQHAETAVELGCSLLAMGETDQASDQLAATVQTCHLAEPLQVRLHQQLGEHAYRAGRSEAAANEFVSALELAPEDAVLQNWLGLCRLQQGELAAATTAFAAAADHGFALAHTNLGICLHQLGRRTDAKACFAKAVELLPHDPVARANFAALKEASAV